MFIRFLQDKQASLKNYLTLFARDFSALFIQTFYFLLLANTLSLSDMGIFAAILSVGMIVGSMMGLGYEELSYRTAIQKPRLLGVYLAGTYFIVLLSVPVGLVMTGLIHAVVFAKNVALLAFFKVIIVELLLWRLIEIYALLNEGLGHFGKIVKSFVLAYSFRAGAAFLFWYSGQNDLALWIDFYLIANILAFLSVYSLFRPKARLRLHIPITLSQLGQAVYLSFTRLMQALQRESDKVIILVLAGGQATGIYTISMRILALISMPVQPFFGLYIRKVLKQRKSDNIIRNNLLVEMVVFGVIITGFLIFMQILQIAPNLLGQNVAAAHFFYSGLIFVPAFKILQDFHSELYFAFNHIKDRALAAAILSASKTLAMVLIVIYAGSIEQWSFWMNLSFALLYLLSLGLVYPIITNRFKTIPALLRAPFKRSLF